jgi:hypothetical protein
MGYAALSVMYDAPCEILSRALSGKDGGEDAAGSI